MKNDQVHRCPSARPHVPRVSSSDGVTILNSIDTFWGTTYGMPWRTTGGRVALRNTAAAKLDLCPDPIRTCMIAETVDPSFYYSNGDGRAQFYAPTVAIPLPNTLQLDRRLGGSNYAFVDGHVKWLKAETVTDAVRPPYINASGNGTGADVPIVMAW